MIREIKARTILQKSRLPKSQYCLNPYVGCTHRCSYCYARFMRRFTGHSGPWGSFVDAKINASEILEQQLKRTHVKGKVLIGSVCDAYQPVEKHYELTRMCIQLLVKYNVEFSVLTKSSLILRDLDLLLQAGPKVSVGVSLTTLDESCRLEFEPGASPVHDRLKTLETLYSRGIHTYAFIGPILPLITDPQAIVETVAPFVDEVWGEFLNLRCGNREDLTHSYTACHLPDTWLALARSEHFRNETDYRLESTCQKTNTTLIGSFKH